MIINNVTLPDIDVADALEMERFEKANDNVSDKMKQLDTNGKRRSELIRAQCSAIFDFLTKFLETVLQKRYSVIQLILLLA